MKMKIIMLLLLITVFVSVGSADLIAQTCSKTEVKDVCISTLRSAPQTSSAGDVLELASASACMCLGKANETLNHMRELIKRSADPDLEKAVAYCAQLYIPVVKYSLPQAIDAICQAHYAFARYGIADARKQADACDNKLPGDSLNADLQRMADVAFAILGILLQM